MNIKPFFLFKEVKVLWGKLYWSFWYIISQELSKIERATKDFQIRFRATILMQKIFECRILFSIFTASF